MQVALLKELKAQMETAVALFNLFHKPTWNGVLKKTRQAAAGYSETRLAESAQAQENHTNAWQHTSSLKEKYLYANMHYFLQSVSTDTLYIHMCTILHPQNKRR